MGCSGIEEEEEEEEVRVLIYCNILELCPKYSDVIFK
jgi:hypothetical protein